MRHLRLFVLRHGLEDASGPSQTGVYLGRHKRQGRAAGSCNTLCSINVLCGPAPIRLYIFRNGSEHKDSLLPRRAAHYCGGYHAGWVKLISGVAPSGAGRCRQYTSGGLRSSSRVQPSGYRKRKSRPTGEISYTDRPSKWPIILNLKVEHSRAIRAFLAVIHSFRVRGLGRQTTYTTAT